MEPRWSSGKVQEVQPWDLGSIPGGGTRSSEEIRPIHLSKQKTDGLGNEMIQYVQIKTGGKQQTGMPKVKDALNNAKVVTVTNDAADSV